MELHELPLRLCLYPLWPWLWPFDPKI